MEKHTAIVLGAGQGKRMKSSVEKQFIHLDGKPILYYSLKALEESFIDEVILVTSCWRREYCKKEIIEKYRFSKVKSIVEGGEERYHSVYQGIQAIEGGGYVWIHDGARPFLTSEILKRIKENIEKFPACIVAVPAKDTVKITDEKGFAKETPNRNRVWLIQTPQVFSYELIKSAYEKLMEKERETKESGVVITDDAMVVETFTDQKVKIVDGTYKNIKITTPEDLKIANIFLKDVKIKGSYAGRNS